MRTIVRWEIRKYLRNPAYWIGLALVALGIYQQVSPYLGVHYFTEQDAEAAAEIPIADSDIMEGVIPTTDENQRREVWEEHLQTTFQTAYGMTAEETRALIAEMKGMDIAGMVDYLEEHYAYLGAMREYEFITRYRKGTAEEVNAYLDRKLQDKSFSWYFSRKYADFASLFLLFFAVVLLSVLFLQDTRKNTYELLHTKPIPAIEYVTGKAAGGFLICAMALMALNVIFYGLCLAGTRDAGFEVHLYDFLVSTAIYILPNMLMVVCVYELTALLFQNPLPAVPVLLLYIIYSNMGSRNAEGLYGYYGRPLAIMVRFPGEFFEITPPPMVLLNQVFLILASAVILLLSVWIWKRRRL